MGQRSGRRRCGNSRIVGGRRGQGRPANFLELARLGHATTRITAVGRKKTVLVISAIGMMSFLSCNELHVLHIAMSAQMCGSLEVPIVLAFGQLQRCQIILEAGVQPLLDTNDDWVVLNLRSQSPRNYRNVPLLRTVVIQPCSQLASIDIQKCNDLSLALQGQAPI